MKKYIYFNFFKHITMLVIGGLLYNFATGMWEDFGFTFLILGALGYVWDILFHGREIGFIDDTEYETYTIEDRPHKKVASTTPTRSSRRTRRSRERRVG